MPFGFGTEEKKNETRLRRTARRNKANHPQPVDPFAVAALYEFAKEPAEIGRDKSTRDNTSSSSD